MKTNKCLLKRNQKKANANTEEREKEGGKNQREKKAEENKTKIKFTELNVKQCINQNNTKKVVHENVVDRKENTQQNYEIRTNYFANLYLGISSIFIVIPSAFFPECTKDANTGLVNWFLGVWACTVRAIILYNLNPA